MTESISERPVTVTAEQRAHPALRMLARALLALARHQLDRANAEPDVQDRPQSLVSPPTAEGRTEGSHDD
jgi:hypothetical protein